MDDEVDVFRAVKQVRLSRPELVTSVVCFPIRNCQFSSAHLSREYLMVLCDAGTIIIKL